MKVTDSNPYRGAEDIKSEAVQSPLSSTPESGVKARTNKIGNATISDPEERKDDLTQLDLSDCKSLKKLPALPIC